MVQWDSQSPNGKSYAIPAICAPPTSDFIQGLLRYLQQSVHHPSISGQYTPPPTHLQLTLYTRPSHLPPGISSTERASSLYIWTIHPPPPPPTHLQLTLYTRPSHLPPEISSTERASSPYIWMTYTTRPSAALELVAWSWWCPGGKYLPRKGIDPATIVSLYRGVPIGCPRMYGIFNSKFLPKVRMHKIN